MALLQVELIRVTVDLVVMVMKVYSPLSTSLKLEPQHPMQLPYLGHHLLYLCVCVGGGHTPLHGIQIEYFKLQW